MTGRRLAGQTRIVICLMAVAAATTGCVFGSPNPSSQPAPRKDTSTTPHVRSDTAARTNRDADPPGVGVWRRFRVGTRLITFDEPAYTAVDGTRVAARRLLTEIRYPLAGRPSKSARPAAGPFPMIVFAPGFMQCGKPYSDLLQFWATAGYVVVTVNFPYSDCLAASPTEDDMLNQPQDMSYVITRMLKLSRARHGVFARLLNPKQIAVAGHSDGGDTVAAIAANTCCTDHRVRAVAVESGAVWPKMRGEYVTKPSVPVLFSQGSADTINPPGCSVYLYQSDRAKPNFYLDLFGASHTAPYWGTTRYEAIVARVTLAFFDRYVLKWAGAAKAMRRQGNVSGLAALFKDRQGNLPPAISASPCY